MAEIVIFVGLQGAGKTTYYNQHFAATHQHISRDLAGTAEREAALIRECLSARQSFVVDNTNTTSAVRAALIQQAKAAGFRISGYFFDVPVRTAIGRNNHRKDKKAIPVPAILRTAKHLEPPSLEEGFDEIHLIRPQPDESRSSAK
jgi:predicted kinase